MSDITFRDGAGRPVHLSVSPGFKPGDFPPNGYSDWHDWAAVQHQAGLRQKTCGKCGKWRFPQELSDKIIKYAAITRDGKTVQMESPICLQCHRTTS